MATIPKEEFDKSLARLESLAKAQLHHTEQSSRTREWAGSKETDEDEYKDGIDDNGTDYNGVKKSLASKLAKGGSLTSAEACIVSGHDPRPAIADKVSKGQDLTPAENWAIKGGVEKMMAACGKDVSKGNEKPGAAGTPGEAKDANSVPPTNAGDNTDDEIEADAKKSLDGAVSRSAALQKGIEMSPFLYEFTRAMSEALRGTEARVAKSVAAAVAPLVQRVDALEKAQSGFQAEQMEFNKSLADGVVAIGHQVEGTAQLADVAATQAAHAPRSQLRAIPGGVQPVQKSFDGNTGNELTKSQITEAMCDMVKSNKLNRLDVIKFETTGQISPQVRQEVMAYVQGAGR